MKGDDYERKIFINNKKRKKEMPERSSDLYVGS